MPFKLEMRRLFSEDDQQPMGPRREEIKLHYTVSVSHYHTTLKAGKNQVSFISHVDPKLIETGCVLLRCFQTSDWSKKELTNSLPHGVKVSLFCAFSVFCAGWLFAKNTSTINILFIYKKRKDHYLVWLTEVVALMHMQYRVRKSLTQNYSTYFPDL